MSDNDMRIIPERDETRSQQQRSSAKKTAPRSGNGQTPVKRAPTSSGGSMMTPVLSVFVVLLAAASAYLYLQTSVLADERDALAARVFDIESKLSVTDESLSQSGAAMQSVLKEHATELETHMAEIRKLWAVAYDRNRVAIETLQKDQKTGAVRINSLVGSVAKLDPIIKGYDGIQSRMETLSSQLLVQSATVDDLSERARTLADRAVSADAKSGSHASSIQEHQEAIDAIDQYRIQINQRLLRLEQNLAPVNTGS